jgi:hypothetical protein
MPAAVHGQACWLLPVREISFAIEPVLEESATTTTVEKSAVFVFPHVFESPSR